MVVTVVGMVEGYRYANSHGQGSVTQSRPPAVFRMAAVFWMSHCAVGSGHQVAMRTWGGRAELGLEPVGSLEEPISAQAGQQVLLLKGARAC